MPNYLDPIRFTSLFADPAGNHRAICEGLFLIANGAASARQFRDEDDREDSIGDALVKCMAAIPKFDLSRLGANAYSYFSSVAANSFTDAVRARKKTPKSLDVLMRAGRDEQISRGHRF